MTETIQLSSLDRHFADFITRIDGHPCDDLWWAAALTSHAAGRGDTCLNLSDAAGYELRPHARNRGSLPPSDPLVWRKALEPCDTVGGAGAYTPLVLDGVNRLYLQRAWEYERMVAEDILSRSCRLAVDAARLDAALALYFPTASGEIDLQREAARAALTHAFSVISGGPGTGKTATVARILALMLHLSGDAPITIALAAPTGKAAMRLRQSILQAAEQLDLPPGIRDRLPSDVSTIHRLLGVRSRGGGFRHTVGNLLPCHVLVVDEASMIDLPLMAHLLSALRPDARVILLGDRNQLASVEAGAVLADICAGSQQTAGPTVTHLTRSYRFGDDSGIGALSRLINSGDSGAAMELLDSGLHADVIWRPLPPGRAFEDAFRAAVREGYAAYTAAGSPAEALEELDRFRVLSPLRSGPYGVEHLNMLCEAALALKRRGDEPYCHLLPVMVTGNNYELGLFNGDTGVFHDHAGRPAVWFNDPESGIRHLSPLRLPPSETAFALTVHKSQGSEFDRLLLILPDRISAAVSRELLYTAVTRARCRIEIWGTETVFRQGVEHRLARTSGLRERLGRQP